MTDLHVPLPELKQLVSNFPAPSSPRGYQPFKEFFLESIYASFSAPNWIEASGNDKLAPYWNIILLNILRKHAPTYYLASELMDSACQTSVPAMEAHEIPFNYLNIFTPNGLAMAVKVEPLCDECDADNVKKIKTDLKELAFQKGVQYNIDDAKVMITALLFTKMRGHKCARSCIDVFPPFGENKDMLVCTPDHFGCGDDLNVDKIYRDMTVSDLARLIVNTLMLITYQPSLVSVEKSSSSGLGFNKKSSDAPMPVRWLGKGFCDSKAQASPSSSQTTSGVTHASPRAHWRRGHWHGYRYGEGRKTLKRKWVQPVYVNPQ